MAGFFAGNLAFSATARWIYALSEAKRAATEPSAAVSRLLVTTLLSSAPWLLVVLGLCAYYLRSEPWMPWVALGFFIALASFGLLILYFRRKQLARAASPAPATPGQPSLLTRVFRYTGTKRGGTIFAYVLALAVLLVMMPSLSPGEDIPVWLWVMMAILLFVAAHITGWYIWEFVHPKPWIERRKAQRPE